MASRSFVSTLALFLAIIAQVSAQSFNYTNPYGSLNDCVNYIYPLVEEYLCTYLNQCHANLCSGENRQWYEYVFYACEYLSGENGNLDKTIKDKCTAASGSKVSAGAIAGGVAGGLAGVAAIGAVGAIAYHMMVSAIPALTHMGIAGAGAGAAAGAASGASQGASGAAQGASGAAHAAHAANAGHAATAGQAGAQGGAQMAQHGAGAASAGHTLGTGPFMGDGGAGHAVGQGAAQAPMGTDGGAMSGGQNIAPGQGFGPNAPGQGVYPDPSGGQGLAPGQGFGPAPGQGYGPGVPGQGVYPDPTGSSAGTSGQGYFGPSYGPDIGQGAAGPGYTSTSSIPSTAPSPSTPSSGAPFGAPNVPQFERTHYSLFGQPRKSTSDEENQRLTNQPQMMQRTTPSASFPINPSFPPPPHIAVDNSQMMREPQPSGAQFGVPLQTSIQYTGRGAPNT